MNKDTNINPLEPIGIRARVLLVDDDPLVLATIKHLLEGSGRYVVATASDVASAKALAAQHAQFPIAIIDYNLPDGTGAELASCFVEQFPSTYVLFLSGDLSREALKQSWKSGAVEFIEKGLSEDRILQTLDHWLEKHKQEFAQAPKLDLAANIRAIAEIGLVGQSSAMAAVAEQVVRYRDVEAPVLILGETGTGKEKIARALHVSKNGDFFALNCASYQSNAQLLESELFGYEKGAFTGAEKTQLGILRSAKRGTVFLDELNTLSVASQQKLLRALQERKVRPVGGTREFDFDARIIAAAKPSIVEMVHNESFLPDFYERINVLNIRLPNLKERLDDISLLAQHFCAQASKQLGRAQVLASKTLKLLERHSWPRNVRELENVIQRLCIDSDSKVLQPEHLFRCWPEGQQLKDQSASPINIRKKADEIMAEEVAAAMRGSTSQRAAARQLGIPESSFRRLIKRYQLNA